MTQFVTVDRATLEQALEVLEETTGLPNTSARIFDNRIMSIRALRAALSNAESTQSKPYAWRNPMNGVVISNDKKERLLCVGRGYPNFSEPLYVAGATP